MNKSCLNEAAYELLKSKIYISRVSSFILEFFVPFGSSQKGTTKQAIPYHPPTPFKGGLSQKDA
jgi:hypothetical protein